MNKNHTDTGRANILHLVIESIWSAAALVAAIDSLIEHILTHLSR